MGRTSLKKIAFIVASLKHLPLCFPLFVFALSFCIGMIWFPLPFKWHQKYGVYIDAAWFLGYPLHAEDLDFTGVTIFSATSLLSQRQLIATDGNLLSCLFSYCYLQCVLRWLPVPGAVVLPRHWTLMGLSLSCAMLLQIKQLMTSGLLWSFYPKTAVLHAHDTLCLFQRWFQNSQLPSAVFYLVSCEEVTLAESRLGFFVCFRFYISFPNGLVGDHIVHAPSKQRGFGNHLLNFCHA